MAQTVKQWTDMLVLGALAMMALAACGTERPVDVDDGPHPLDLQPLKSADGVPASFDRNQVMTDAFFSDTGAVSVEGLQRFLESSPYGNRSWLADARVDGQAASAVIVAVAHELGVNPLVLVTRIQVESSLVSKTRAPSASKVAFLMGCGCPDGRACNERYRGFGNQLRCAGQTFRNRFDDSVDGSGAWRKGIARRTLDPLTVTPVNHATAAHYAYTPWVLQGRGGNWLAWNISRLYARHADALGVLNSGGAEIDAPPPPSHGEACGTFADVGRDHPSYGAIEAGVEAGLWSGCAREPLRFCPELGASRAMVASILARALSLPMPAARGVFSDVPASHWAAPAVEALYDAGVVAGCGNGRFCPDDKTRRVELAVMVAGAAGYTAGADVALHRRAVEPLGRRVAGDGRRRGHHGGLRRRSFLPR